MILLKELKSRIITQSEIERFNRAKLKLQDKATKLGGEILIGQNELIQLQQEKISNLDSEILNKSKEAADLKETTNFLNYRCNSLKSQTLDLQQENELKETFKTLSQAEANSEPKTGVSEEPGPELDNSPPYEFQVEKSDENGRGSITRKRKF